MTSIYVFEFVGFYTCQSVCVAESVSVLVVDVRGLLLIICICTYMCVCKYASVNACVRLWAMMSSLIVLGPNRKWSSIIDSCNTRMMSLVFYLFVFYLFVFFLLLLLLVLLQLLLLFCLFVFVFFFCFFVLFFLTFHSTTEEWKK